MKKPDRSQIDELTQLLSRKGFLDIFSETLTKAKANPQEAPLSLALLDVDKFKGINDEFGHVTGDHVLVAVAKVIQAHVGKMRWWGATGGMNM